MKKPAAPPFRPLFLAALVLVLVARAMASHFGEATILWVGAIAAVAIGAYDVFRWLHQQAVFESRRSPGPEA